MFERFTERARHVVVLAQDEARLLKHGYIGTEHLLLGLLREEEGIAARVLDTLDVTVEEARAQVLLVVGRGAKAPTGRPIPLAPAAKEALELALREALSLGHNCIGTEHILLGLVRENEGVAARILLEFDADLVTIRNEVIHMLSGPEPSVRVVPRRARGRAQPDAEPPPEMRTFHVTFHRANPDGTHETLGLKVHAESPDEAIDMDYRGHVPDHYLTADVRRTAEQIPYEDWKV
jgi:ATP-dependent Clp protease ATP-binding subunit ClpC